MKVEVLQPHGLCAGVNAAVKTALSLRDVHCLHELVHNEIVLDDLRQLGYRFVDRVEDVPEGGTVVFSAHGVSPAIRHAAAARGLRVVDTTCPFVSRVHQAARDFAKRGLFVVILGDPGHVEVEGIAGEVEDVGGRCRVLAPADSIPDDLPMRVGVVSQTTMDADWVERRTAELATRYAVESCGTVCHATRDRQQAVRAFAGDALLVLGSRKSANVRRLVEIAPCPVFLAGNTDEVRKAKEDMESYENVGVTSGASTPERLMDSAVRCLNNVPRHVAMIMDGNGRWATKRGKKRGEGHIAGAKTLTKVMGWCRDRDIKYVTVYAFSTENWKRPEEEVSGLMRLFAAMIRSQTAALVRNQVRFRVIGRRGDLPPTLQKAIADLEKRTAQFERQLVICISYGGRAEIVDAVNQAVARGEKVTEETFRSFLYAPDLPDPDLIIRTSGELRTSNFLLWESAYSEYYFTDTLWPDFSERDLDAALADYATRHRRKGGVK